jgi:hypothetical protein
LTLDYYRALNKSCQEKKHIFLKKRGYFG